MDNEWAIGQLQQFIDMTGQDVHGGPAGWYTTMAKRDDILACVGVVRSILDVAAPRWEQLHLVKSDQEFGQMRDAAIEARSALVLADEVAAHLDPPAPALSSDNLHPWVREPASPLWRDGHFRAAVQAAATGLDTRLQDLTGRRDVSATDLVNQCLSAGEPQPGKPKLRAPYQGNDDTTKSVQQGLLALGQACFLLVRNPNSHRLDDLPEQEALELMAMLSLFARTVETCTVETVDGPFPGVPAR